MNILAITSLLPIPGFTKTNDCVFQTYIHYRNKFQKDNIVFINTIRYNLDPIKILGKQTLLARLKKQFSGEAHGFKILIFPFFSTWGYRNIHALITRTVYYVNIRKIEALLKQHKFDVIHAQYIFPDGLLACILSKKLGIPYLVTSHNERYYFEHSISKKIAITIFRNASKVLPINYTNYLFYRSLGLNNIYFTPLGFNKSFLRTQKPLSTGKTSILTIAELIKLKNIDKVLRAIEPLVSSHDVHYTIIGQGPEKENLMSLAESLNLHGSC